MSRKASPSLTAVLPDDGHLLVMVTYKRSAHLHLLFMDTLNTP
jgi:hypothetical protein